MKQTGPPEPLDPEAHRLFRLRVLELLEEHRGEQDERTRNADSEFCNYSGASHRGDLEETWRDDSELARLGPQSASTLIGLLEDPSASTRSLASEALCALRLAPDPLWQALVIDPRIEVASPAIVAVANAKPPWALAGLASAFAAPAAPAGLRELIVKAAAAVDLAGARELLLASTRDADRSVRHATVEPLAALGDDEAIAALESMVTPPVCGMLSEAAYALERVARARRREALGARVEAGDLEPLAEVASVGDPRAIPPLLAQLEATRGAQGAEGLSLMWSSGRWSAVEQACAGRSELLAAAGLAAKGRIYVSGYLDVAAKLLTSVAPERALLPLEVAARRTEPESLVALDRLLLEHSHERVLVPLLCDRAARTTHWYATRFRAAIRRFEAGD